MGLFDKKVKRKGSGLFDSEDAYNVDTVKRQIENASTRIQDAGYQPINAEKRNWFEKATNLPEDQNAFFDVLELIGRPGAGVVNAVNESVQGGDALSGFGRGFTGRDRTRGADLAETLGVENGVGKFLLGTGLDIALDPVTYVPGGVIAKGAMKGSQIAGDVAKAGLNAVERVAPGFGNVRQGASDLIGRGKDALGYGLVPDYKLGEDLFGRSDDTVKNLKQQTENNIGFMTDESMRNVSDAAKVAGGVDTGADVGRLMEKDLTMIGPRPAREINSDPNIQQAAKNLMDSNAELRQWATENDIPVGELEGYMTHVLSQAERQARSKTKSMPIDRGNFGTGQPNKKILSERKLQGSVEDINDQMGREFFEPNAFFSSAVGQKRLIEYANSAKFRREVLSNSNFAQKYESGMEIPSNAVKIDSNNYKFLSDDAGELADEIGGEYVVTKAVKQSLDRYKKLTSDEGINSFIKAFDTAQSFWKRGTLFSIPYHLRNISGAMFNNYVGGMNAASLVKYTGESYPEVYKAYVNGAESPLFREFREQGLGSSGQLQIEFARRGQEPEDAIRKTIEKRSKQDGTLGTAVKTELADLKNPLNAFETSKQFGDFNDQAQRFAMYKWAKDKGMTPEQAAAKVREVQFDYSKTTPFEREVATRVAPFYRWMRNNLPFQLRSFINDPRKYANVNKIRLNAQDAAGIDDENVPAWMKEGFAVPVTGTGDGKGRFLGLNLPVGDLAKATDPLKMLTDSLTPIAKLPLEVAQNRSFFTGKPIEKFAGQEKQYSIPKELFGAPVPGGGTDLGGVDATLAYILEQLGGQPVRGLSNTLQAPDAANQEQKFLAPGLGISSLFKEYDVNKSKYFEQRDELQKLLDLIKYIEQQSGQPVRTLNEMKKAK